MKSKELLFELVHSLTKSEKRFIKLNAQMHKGNKVYLTLMDAIAKQKEYDEEELLRLFKNEDFIKQFSVAKNYLQNFILKQLRQYHSGLKASIECKHLLIDIEVMFWKGQYRLAEKLIGKAEKIATDYEQFLVLEDLHYWNERIHSALLRLNAKNVKEIKDKHHNNINKYINILEYKDLVSQTHLLTKKSEIIRDSEESEQYQKLIENPLLKDVSKAESYLAKYSFYVLNSVLKRISGNIEESGRLRAKLVEHVESNSKLLHENPIHYTAALHNLLMYSLIIHDHDLYHSTINKLKNFDFKMPHEKANMFSTLCLFELGYYTEYGKYEDAVTFVEETVDKYDNLSNLLNLEHEFLLHYHAALAYYFLGDFNNALKWINKVINLTAKDLRIDVKASTYVLNIMTHYELDNLDLLPYLVKSTINFFKANKVSTKIDEFFLNIFKKIPSNRDKTALKLYLIEIKKVMEKMDSKSIIVPDIDYFEWINKKIGE